ncbi:histidine-specific methyltransferase [Trichoderma evansii]
MELDSGLSENRNLSGQMEHDRPVKPSSNDILQEKTSAEIQGSDNSGIQQLISQGLRSTPRSLPSLLLWDSIGLDLYEKITESPDYYLTRIEADVIRNNVDAIVQSIGANGVILELGSGSLSKTSIILGEFARREMPLVNVNIQFLIGVDGNKVASTVSRAYDPSNGLSRRFALNGINNVNRILGASVFEAAKWTFDGTWDPQEEAFHTSIRSVEDQEVIIADEPLQISKGENIRFILSRKLSSSQFEKWLTDTALQIMMVWEYSKFNYGLYQLAPASKSML